MTDLLKQLIELVPLAAAATPGPWALCSPNFPEAINTADDKQHIALANIGAGIPHMANAALTVAARNLLTQENLTLITTQQEQIAKLQAFKDFVHTTLDAADIDKHEEQNATTGCRIGARLRDLIGDASQAKHSYHCAQQAYAREMDSIIARDNAQASLQALCAALATPVAEWVSTTTPPAPCDSPNGPAPFSPDVLLWINENEAPIVGYYDYRAGYDCYQAYGLGEVGTTHWALIVPPTAPATMEGAQPHV